MASFNTLRRILTLTTALIPAGLAVGALSGSASAADQAAAKDGPAVVQEVIVTATRSSQALSKVPLSISAFSQDSMDKQGIRDFGDIAKYTPGVTFDESTNNISIRGVSSNTGDATTGIYIDDTPIQIRDLGFSSTNSLPIVFDLERVEVLRGPQGTLFGAGSEGGTVRYITPEPSLSKFSSYGRTEVASTKDGGPSYEAGVASGGPIIEDKLGFRVSADFRHDGGYVDRVDPYTGLTAERNANWKDTYVLRGALKWAPTDRLIIIPTLQFQSRNQNDTDQYWIASPTGAGRVNGNPDRANDNDHYLLGSFKAEYDLGKVKVISDTSAFYRRDYSMNRAYEGTLYNLAFFGGSFVAYGVDPALPDGNTCGAGACAALAAGGSASPLLTANGINLPGYVAQYGQYHAFFRRQLIQCLGGCR